MATSASFFPPMPPVGQSATHYEKMIRDADAIHSVHARAAAKAGQYVTLGIQEDVGPEKKMKYFWHALQRHCATPSSANETVEAFYDRLCDFVRLHASQEAIRVASMEDDRFALRERHGEPKQKLIEEGRLFFTKLLGMGNDKPDLFTEEAWAVLRMIRSQWT